MNAPVITELKIYPLKSAQPISLQKMEIDGTGPKYDRHWMLVNKNSSFISQRTHPQMGQLFTELDDEFLTIHTKQQESIKLSLKERSDENIEVKLFNKSVQAETVNQRSNEWFSDFLGQAVTLVRSPEKPTRTTSGNHGPLATIDFPDGYPFLLTNKATLDELNSKLENPITMDRFRPNIVIEGAPANEEDQWTGFEINGVNFLSVKACTRCVVIDIDPKTGKKSNDVTRTLRDYRVKNGQVIFGCNLSHSNQGSIRVGNFLVL